MPWKYNNIIIREGRSWTNNDGIQHPRNWSIWSDEDKVANGLVWEEPEATVDNRFYWSANNPKELEDQVVIDLQTSVTSTDEFGNVMYTDGLKTVWKNQTNESANSQLQSTDWMIIANAERGRTIPTSVSNYRAAVVSCSNVISTQIDNCTSIAEFIALFDTPTTVVDGVEISDGNAPIYNWPNIKAY